ncbi:MAG TPA: YfhO family protein [Clostridiaceae bacterium]|nr:YfhO family protein [Clostridiaceae bacterium]
MIKDEERKYLLNADASEIGSAKKLERRALLYTAGIAFLVALVIFLPALIRNGPKLWLVGDFNDQQIPFNLHALKVIKSGKIGFDPSVDLGTQFIGAFGFYNLGSPFFWLTLLFPVSAFPYLVAWLFIFKYMIAAVTAYVFIRRYVRLSWAASLGALLYAFSGFSHLHIMYHHFHDVIALFPLLLWAVDEKILEDRRGVLALVICLNALTNYFFFVGQVVFILLYFAFQYGRSLSRQKRLLKIFLACLIEGVFGVAMAAVLLVPSLLFIVHNPRSNAYTIGEIIRTFFTPNRYPALLKEFLLPAEVLYNNSAFIKSNFYGMSLYLPLIGGTMLFERKTSCGRLRKLLVLCLIMALLPILNSIFYLFSDYLFARWYYMPILIMALLSARQIEETQAFNGLFVIPTLLIAMISLLSFAKTDLLSQPVLFLKTLVLSLAGYFLTAVIVILCRDSAVRVVALLLGVIVFSILTGWYSLAMLLEHQTQKNEDPFLEQKFVEDSGHFPSIKPGYRLMSDWRGSNISLYADVPSINSFISTISPQLFSFYEAIGNPRYVSTKIVEEPLPLAAALSVSHILKRRPLDFIDSESTSYELQPESTYKGRLERIEVLSNNFSVCQGFAHEYYISRSDFDNRAEDKRRELLLKAFVVEDDDIVKIEDILQPLPTEEYLISWQEAVKKRAEKVPLHINYDNKGFRADYNFANEEIVWISIPNDPGFSCYINGVQTEIIESVSMIGLRVPPGPCRVEIIYKTPGLRIGLAISVLALIIWGAWLAFPWLKKQQTTSEANMFN